MHIYSTCTTTSEVLVGSGSCYIRCNASHGKHHMPKFSKINVPGLHHMRESGVA